MISLYLIQNLENRDVYKVLVYEEVKKRSLSYYTEFFEKKERQRNIACSQRESRWNFPVITGIGD